MGKGERKKGAAERESRHGGRQLADSARQARSHSLVSSPPPLLSPHPSPREKGRAKGKEKNKEREGSAQGRGEEKTPKVLRRNMLPPLPSPRLHPSLCYFPHPNSVLTLSSLPPSPRPAPSPVS